MNVKQNVADRLLEFRKQQGWSVRQLTEELNKALPANNQIAFPTVAAWEQGRNPVSFFVMFFLAKRAKGALKHFADDMCKAMTG